MKALLRRIYNDYLTPSRLSHHESLLLQARDAGFSQASVRQFHRSLKDGTVSGKALVHRHDIDTDLRTARKLFKLEARLGIHSSFYFRLSTLDIGLMREIDAYGSEASYHYEELATYAKKNHINSAAAIRARLPAIRAQFEANFRSIEQRLGSKLTTVASHGDFANRRLNVSNTEILDDPALRARCAIECETYDQHLLAHFDVYITDRPAPQHYHPIAPVDALARHGNICLLTHPRQFESNWGANTKDNLLRFYEGLAW